MPKNEANVPSDGGVTTIPTGELDCGSITEHIMQSAHDMGFTSNTLLFKGISILQVFQNFRSILGSRKTLALENLPYRQAWSVPTRMDDCIRPMAILRGSHNPS